MRSRITTNRRLRDLEHECDSLRAVLDTLKHSDDAEAWQIISVLRDQSSEGRTSSKLDNLLEDIGRRKRSIVVIDPVEYVCDRCKQSGYQVSRVLSYDIRYLCSKARHEVKY